MRQRKTPILVMFLAFVEDVSLEETGYSTITRAFIINVHI